MTDFEDSIAHKAHGLVYGERAKTYGHPRFDFTAIAKVWTGLLQDLLKDDAQLDAYRISILMTGLKLCRLVKSPQHKDSRIDTIGYMLTMERLDEPEEVDWEKVKKVTYPISPEQVAAEAEQLEGHDEDNDPPDSAYRRDDDADEELEDSGHNWAREAPKPVYNQVKVWFDAGETQYINGNAYTNAEGTGKLIVFPFLPPSDVTVSKFPTFVGDSQHGDFPKFGTPEFDAKAAEVAAEQAKNWPKPVHDHRLPEPCVPPCPVWAEGRPAFGFTGEKVELKPSTPWERND
jgi:hypothetical protein